MPGRVERGDHAVLRRHPFGASRDAVLVPVGTPRCAPWNGALEWRGGCYLPLNRLGDHVYRCSAAPGLCSARSGEGSS